MKIKAYNEKDLLLQAKQADYGLADLLTEIEKLTIELKASNNGNYQIKLMFKIQNLQDNCEDILNKNLALRN